MSRRELARRLAVLEGFDAPRVDLEQYPTPPDVAAQLVHLAALRGDLDRPVLDLGTGTGVLAVAAALRGAEVVGVERDAGALSVATRNAAALGVSPAWVLGDATRLPICPAAPVTVLANPPFGARAGREHADRSFLESTARVAAVSYTIHNEGSLDFLEAFAADAGAEVTDAFEAPLALERRFAFHEEDEREVRAEAVRIEWDQ